MTARPRKLVGMLALIVFLILYVWVAVAIDAGGITEAYWLVQLAYFLIAGLLWVIPAGLLIRWMQRPD